MAKIDHHLHTSRHSPDSIIDPMVLIDRAKRAGLDAVVITEHDYQWEAGELAALNEQSEGLLILSGVEVSTREGHFLVYGMHNPFEAPPGIELKDLLRAVWRQEAAIVAAHPFRWDQDFGKIVKDRGAVFDAVELVSNNVTPETRARTEALLLSEPMATTGSSDGHEPDAIGCYYTEFPSEVRSMRDFVLALKSGDGRPRHRPGAWQTSGPVD